MPNDDPTATDGGQQATDDRQPTTDNGQPITIGDRPLATNGQRAAVTDQPLAVDGKQSTVGSWQAAVSGQRSGVEWRVAGASVQGTSHEARAEGCQDAHAYRVLTNGTLVIAVADGAGSAPRSAEGARRAADTLTAWLGDELEAQLPESETAWRVLTTEAFRQARRGVARLAQSKRKPVRLFATTLTCAVATQDYLIVGQIGDGIAVGQDDEGTLIAPIRPRRGEYANEAAFLTMRSALNYLDIAVSPLAIQAVAVTTDGMLRLATKLPSYEPSLAFYRPLLAFAANAENAADAEDALAAFLASERVRARTDDDKTLVLAARIMQDEPELESVPEAYTNHSAVVTTSVVSSEPSTKAVTTEEP